MRYFLNISYKGTHFHGWQIQPNAFTVQEHLEDCFSKILGEKIAITASGRTDAGVHASGQIAHFDTTVEIDIEKFTYKINSFINKDVAINLIIKVKDDVHARFDAQERTYHYFISDIKNPFNQELYWYLRHQLDVIKMNKAALILYKYQDFTSFSKLHTDTPHNLCMIHYAQFEYIENGLRFTITANRFLRGMVRAIVGSLVDVGLGKITPNDFENIIIGKDRKLASSNAPAEGLFLAKITYDKDIYL